MINLELFILTFILTCMASVSKRLKSRFWTACYTDHNGRQLKRSTKTTDRNAAMVIALEYERAEKQAKQGVLITTQLRKVLSDVSEKVNGDSLHVDSVEVFLEKWLEGIAVRNSRATLERYRNAVKWFLKNLQARAQKPIFAITPQDVENFLTARLKCGLANKTVVLDLKIIKSAFQQAVNYGTIPINPVSAVRLPRVVSMEREVFTHDEVQKLITAAPSLDWETLITLGYFTGARLSDCVQMTWDNIFAAEGLIKYRQQKTGKVVMVPMHFEIIKHLHYKGTFGTTGFLCPNLAAKSSGGKHGLSEGFNRIVRKAGLDPMTVKGKGLRKFSRRTFHSLRHTFNSTMADAGVAPELRMTLTGHQSQEMNRRYTHLQMETLQKAVNAVPLFGAKNAGG